EPIVLAEERRPGLKAYVDQQLAGAKDKPSIIVQNGIVAMGGPRSVGRVGGGFTATPLWNRISQSYNSGVGWIFAVDMEQILKNHVPKSVPMQMDSGLDNVRFLVIERKENLGRTQHSASLDFAGARHGMASWLAAPGPMGTLDFVSPDASFAGSFVVKNPGALLREVLTSAPPTTVGGV